MEKCNFFVVDLCVQLTVVAGSTQTPGSTVFSHAVCLFPTVEYSISSIIDLFFSKDLPNLDPGYSFVLTCYSWSSALLFFFNCLKK